MILICHITERIEYSGIKIVSQMLSACSGSSGSKQQQRSSRPDDQAVHQHWNS